MSRDLDFGPQWLDGNGKKLSPEGRRVARFCEWLFDGIYHEQDAVLRARWDRFFVQLTLSGEMSTFDASRLTRLVVGAHDFGIRVAISAANPHYFRVDFHPRHSRTGNFYRRHPTLDQALAAMVRAEEWEPESEAVPA